MRKLALYIHIPFCKSKCYYCDFKSFSNKNEIIGKYIQSLNKEIDIYSKQLNNYKIDTIFIGGGTPSYIDANYIYDILNNIYRKFYTSQLQEITIECNPKTLDNNKLAIYRELGINRVSLGVQSLNDNLLKNIGRIHNSKDFYESFNLIDKYGFKNINTDIMFGLPDQTLEDVLITLKQMIKLKVKHISFYSLILEKGTKFYEKYKLNALNLPNEDLERDMYHKGIKFLKNNGYNHYEISNLSQKGYECRHNLYYWKVKPYVGIGLGSHSNIKGLRYWNFGEFKDYFRFLKKDKLPVQGKESIDKEMEMAEYMMLGLRLVDGISKKEFKQRFNVCAEKIYNEVLKKHQKNGLIFINEDRIKLTDKGLDLANIVFVDLLPN